jgi:hypothetical protein
MSPIAVSFIERNQIREYAAALFLHELAIAPPARDHLRLAFPPL